MTYLGPLDNVRTHNLGYQGISNLGYQGIYSLGYPGIYSLGYPGVCSLAYPGIYVQSRPPGNIARMLRIYNIGY